MDQKSGVGEAGTPMILGCNLAADGHAGCKGRIQAGNGARADSEDSELSDVYSQGAPGVGAPCGSCGHHHRILGFRLKGIAGFSQADRGYLQPNAGFEAQKIALL